MHVHYVMSNHFCNSVSLIAYLAINLIDERSLNGRLRESDHSESEDLHKTVYLIIGLGNVVS